MKKKKLITKILLFAVMSALLLTIAGCGGKVRADAELEGVYIPVVSEVSGVTTVGDAIDLFDIELQSGGKAVITIDGEDHTAKWENDDTTITITADGEKIVGNLGEDTFTIDDILDLGMKVVFARKGSKAADPEQYMPETDKFMIGKWTSTEVTDVLGDPVEDMAPDALTIEFFSDYTVKFTLDGQAMGPYKWSNLDNWGSLDDEDSINLNWDIYSDRIEVNFYTDDDYYIFICPKGA